VLDGLIASGAVTPLVDRVLPLAETAAAVRRVLDGQAVGKVVVAVR
jgi:NADPH:quinone reductase-like Zn-dependent oxidoreductase